jgi:hypothetical protein
MSDNEAGIRKVVEEYKKVRKLEIGRVTAGLRSAISANKKREADGGSSAPKPKRPKKQVDITGMDWPALLQSDDIQNQTTDVLKAFCGQHGMFCVLRLSRFAFCLPFVTTGLPKNGNKQALVDRVTVNVTAQVTTALHL